MSTANDENFDDEREATAYVTNIHEDVLDTHLYELFIQAGPVEKVSLLKNPNKPIQAFILFKHDVSVPYACHLLDGIRLFNKAITVKPRTGTRTFQKFMAQQKEGRRSSTYSNPGGLSNPSMIAPLMPPPMFMAHPLMPQVPPIWANFSPMLMRSSLIPGDEPPSSYHDHSTRSSRQQDRGYNFERGRNAPTRDRSGDSQSHEYYRDQHERGATNDRRYHPYGRQERYPDERMDRRDSSGYGRDEGYGGRRRH